MESFNIDKIQYLSDLHLEYNIEPTPSVKSANVVALLGDIGDPMTEVYSTYIRKMACMYDIVFLILGNHEYFGHSIIEIETHMEKVMSTLPKNVITNSLSLRMFVFGVAPYGPN